MPSFGSRYLLRTVAAALTSTALACGPTPIRADAYQGWYVGGGIGELQNLNFDYLSGPGGDSYGYAYQHSAYQLFGGWRFSRYLSVEGSYIDLGSYSNLSIPISNKISGFAPWLVGTLPLGRTPIELFGKIGGYWNDDHLAFSGAYTSASYFSFVYGAGIGAVMARRIALRFEFDELNLHNTYDTGVYWATLAYRF